MNPSVEPGLGLRGQVVFYYSLGSGSVAKAKLAADFSVDFFHLFDLLFEFLTGLSLRLKLLLQLIDVNVRRGLRSSTGLLANLARGDPTRSKIILVREFPSKLTC